MAHAIFEPNLFPYHFSFLVHSTYSYMPMKIEQTECSKMSAYKLQMPGSYPKESIQHTEHSESLKSINTSSQEKTCAWQPVLHSYKSLFT